MNEDARTSDFAAPDAEPDPARRHFITSAVGVGFALAVQPIMAQTAIRTDTEGLLAGAVRIATPDGELTAYRAQPATAKKPPVLLVVSEIFGVHEYIADVCRRLARLGYLAIAPELFTRQGDPRTLDSIDQILAQIIAHVPDTQVLSDLDACVAWAKVSGGDTARLGITGFCWGGRFVWLYAAHQPALKAGVAWYGRLAGDASPLTPRQPLDVAGELQAPVLGLYGGADTGIPLDSVRAMQEALKRAGGHSQIHLYDGAPHAFHADYRPSYRPDAAEDGWRRMREWFALHLA